MSNKYKKGMTLMELVITIAVTSIVLAEIGTFLVFFQKQTVYINDQEEVFLAITTIREEINQEFNSYYSQEGYKIEIKNTDENCNIIIKYNDTIKKTGEDIWSETVVKNGYDNRIDKMVFEEKEDYIKCTLSYLNSSLVEQKYMFIIVNHLEVD